MSSLAHHLVHVVKYKKNLQYPRHGAGLEEQSGVKTVMTEFEGGGKDR